MINNIIIMISYVLTIKLFDFDFSITNALLITILGFLCFSGILYFFSSNKNYLNKSSFSLFSIKFKYNKQMIQNNFLIKNFLHMIISLFNTKIFRYLFIIYFSFILNMDYLDLEKFKTINLPESIECIKMQELGFLPEYYFIMILFCLILFSLFSLKLRIDNARNFSIKFKYNNQLIFLLIFGLICYLVLLLQQINIYTLSLLSFNNTIHNDQLSLIAKFVIGLSSILYLIFITQYLKRQRLSIFGQFHQTRHLFHYEFQLPLFGR